ncbi:MAG: lytic transglycosylase domain-containing protein [Chitinophagaceae bacterium]
MRKVIIILSLFFPFVIHAQDKLIEQKVGFGSLFANNSFDASKPYYAQLSPKAVPFVQEYIRKYGKSLTNMKQWGRPYFDLYDQILPIYGIPKELKYLSVIESHLRSGLQSWAGAVGPWQIMDYEAKRMGLQVGNGIDERTNYTKSTHAAAKLLRELYNMFGDWLLVIAAYNGGAGRVKQAIRKAGSANFWDLQMYLREETRVHVKKFIGTHYLFEGSGGITTTAKQDLASLIDTSRQIIPDSIMVNTKELPIKGRMLANIICNKIGISKFLFNQLNPDFDRKMTTNSHQNLRLPIDKINLFEEKREEILMETLQLLLNQP